MDDKSELIACIESGNFAKAARIAAGKFSVKRFMNHIKHLIALFLQANILSYNKNYTVCCSLSPFLICVINIKLNVLNLITRHIIFHRCFLNLFMLFSHIITKIKHKQQLLHIKNVASMQILNNWLVFMFRKAEIFKEN